MLEGNSIFEENEEENVLLEDEGNSIFENSGESIFDSIKFEEDLKKYSEFSLIKDDLKKVVEKIEPMIKESISKGDQEMIERYGDLYTNYAYEGDYDAEKSIAIINRAFDPNSKLELQQALKDKYDKQVPGRAKSISENPVYQFIDETGEDTVKFADRLAIGGAKMINRTRGKEGDGITTEADDIGNAMHGLIGTSFTVASPLLTKATIEFGKTDTGQKTFQTLEKVTRVVSNPIIDKLMEGESENTKETHKQLLDLTLTIGIFSVLGKGYKKVSQKLKTKDIINKTQKTTAEIKADYGVLGLKKGATLKEVKTAFRKKAMETHPDKGGKASDFQKVMEATENITKNLQEGLVTEGVNPGNIKTYKTNIREFQSKFNTVLSRMNRLNAEAKQELIDSPRKFYEYVGKQIQPYMNKVSERITRINSAQDYYNDVLNKYGRTVDPKTNANAIGKAMKETKSIFPDVNTFFYGKRGSVGIFGGGTEGLLGDYGQDLFDTYVRIKDKGKLYNIETPYSEYSLGKTKSELSKDTQSFYSLAKEHIDTRGIKDKTTDDIFQDMVEKFGDTNKTKIRQKSVSEVLDYSFNNEKEVLEYIDILKEDVRVNTNKINKTFKVKPENRTSSMNSELKNNQKNRKELSQDLRDVQIFYEDKYSTIPNYDFGEDTLPEFLKDTPKPIVKEEIKTEVDTTGQVMDKVDKVDVNNLGKDIEPKDIKPANKLGGSKGIKETIKKTTGKQPMVKEAKEEVEIMGKLVPITAKVGLTEEQKTLIDKVSKIDTRQKKGTLALNNLETLLNDVTSGQEKQQIIREAKKLLSRTQITGQDTTKIINTVTKLFVKKNQKISDIKSIINKFRKSNIANAEAKQQILEDLDDNFIVKLTRKEKNLINELNDIDYKLKNGIDLTDGELITLADNRKDMDDIIKKKSLSDMNFDELDLFEKSLKKQIERATDEGKYNTKQYEQKLEQKSENFGKDYIKPIKPKLLGLEFSGSEIIGGYFLNDINFFSSRNLTKLKEEYADIPYNKYEREWYGVLERYSKIHDKLKINNLGYIKIGLHGLMKRGGLQGVNKVMTYLTKVGTPTEISYIQKKLIKSRLFKQKGLSIKNAEKLILEITKENFLNKEELEMYDFMRGEMENIREDVFDVLLRTENKTITAVDDYRPIIVNQNLMSNIKDQAKMDMLEIGNSITKKYSLEKGFTKKVKGGEVIPILDGRMVFLKHMNDAIYYKNMAEPLIDFKKVVDGFSDKLSVADYSRINDYIKGLSNKFAFPRDLLPGEKLIERGLTNARVWVLGFNLTSTIVQVTALLEGKMLGTIPSIMEAVSYMSGRKKVEGLYVLDWAKKYSNTIKFRSSGDYILPIDAQRESFVKTKFKKLSDMAFVGQSIIDQTIGSVTYLMVYNKAIETGLSVESAHIEAEKQTIRTIGTGRSKDLTPIQRQFSKGIFSTLFVYQTFPINRANNLYWSIKYGKAKAGDGEVILKKYKDKILKEIKQATGKEKEKLVEEYKAEYTFWQRNYGKFMRTVYMAFMFIAIEETIRHLNNTKLYKKDPKSISGTVQNSLLGTVPIIRNLVGEIKYGGYGIIGEGYDLIETITSGKSFGKKISELTEFLTKFSGVPGGLQTKEIIRAFKKKDKKKKKSKLNDNSSIFEDEGGIFEDNGNSIFEDEGDSVFE